MQQIGGVQYGTPLSEAEQRRSLNAAIHQAVGGVGGSDAAIHIVYASVVSMGEGEGWSLSSRKYLHFGTGVSRLDQMKVRQIVPAPELEIAAPVSQNDTYLAAYVDELIAALKDPDYVVTGSVKYDGNLYFDGDTIYVVNTSGALVSGVVSPHPQMKLQIHGMHNSLLSTVSWAENPVGTTGNALSLVNMQPDLVSAELHLQGPHYTGISEVTAHYGGGEDYRLYISYKFAGRC